MNPMRRLAQIKSASKGTWLSPEVFECVCGMKFRYENNLKEHCKKCIDFKYGKQED